MTDMPYLFALAALLAAVLGSIAVWSPRRLTMKATALCAAGLFMPLGFLGFSDLLSRPKPVSLEWWHGEAKEANVLAGYAQEGKGIYLWLQMPGSGEPRAYELPWTEQMAQQLQDALRDSQANGGSGVKMRLPFEPTLDAREPKFYAMPQPALPPKDAPSGPMAAPQRFIAPGQDA